jgi:hypothetical protein
MPVAPHRESWAELRELVSDDRTCGVIKDASELAIFLGHSTIFLTILATWKFVLIDIR